jgi:Flp pilus assembly protein protease CpaA
MVFVITSSAIAAFAITVLILIINSIDDLRTRMIPNRFVIVGVIIGLMMGLQTGHLIEHAVLHLTAVLVTLILGYVLFRIGALGGADVKTLFTIAIISPGVEFTSWENPVLEGIVIVGLLLVITLMVGYLISQRKTDETDVIPLIPIILGAYLVLQLLALIYPFFAVVLFLALISIPFFPIVKVCFLRLCEVWRIFQMSKSRFRVPLTSNRLSDINP